MYIYEIAEKTPQQHLEGQPTVNSSKPNYNRTSIHESSHNLMSCHSQSVEPSPLSWIAVMSCHDIRLTFSSAPNGGCREVYVIFPTLNNYRNICVFSLCCISRSKTQSWCWLGLLDTQKHLFKVLQAIALYHWLTFDLEECMVELTVCRQGIPKRQEKLIILTPWRSMALMTKMLETPMCCTFLHQKLEGRSNQKHNPISLDL